MNDPNCSTDTLQVNGIMYKGLIYKLKKWKVTWVFKGERWTYSIYSYSFIIKTIQNIAK